MRKILLRPEYFCIPVWENSDDPDAVGTIELDTLPISGDLVQAIEQWADQFQATFNEAYPPNSDFESAEDAQAFDATGQALWQRLGQELGSDYAVAYKSVVTQKYYAPTSASTRPFKPTQINEAAWAQFEQALDAERQAGHDVQVDIQVINLPNADRRPIILGAAYTVDGAPFYHAFHYHNDAVYDLSEASLKELHQALRNTIHEAVQGPWETARVVAEIHEDDHGLLYGRFSSPQARQEQGVKVDYRLFFVLRELRSRAATPWVQAQFTLTNDGWLTIHATHADTTTSSEQHHV